MATINKKRMDEFINDLKDALKELDQVQLIQELNPQLNYEKSFSELERKFKYVDIDFAAIFSTDEEDEKLARMEDPHYDY